MVATTPPDETAPAESALPPVLDLAGAEAALIRAAEKARQRACAVNHPNGCCRDGHGARAD